MLIPCLLPAGARADTVHHELRVVLEPAAHRLQVWDKVSLPAAAREAGDAAFAGSKRFIEVEARIRKLREDKDLGN